MIELLFLHPIIGLLGLFSFIHLFIFALPNYLLKIDRKKRFIQGTSQEKKAVNLLLLYFCVLKLISGACRETIRINSIRKFLSFIKLSVNFS